MAQDPNNYDVEPAPKFAPDKPKEKTWVDSLDDIFTAIGAGGLAMTDATQGTTFYKDFVARQDKEKADAKALEKEDRDAKREEWRLQQQHNANIAQLQIEKQLTNQKQNDDAAMQLTEAIINKGNAIEDNLSAVAGHKETLEFRYDQILKSGLSDAQKQIHIAMLEGALTATDSRYTPLLRGQIVQDHIKETSIPDPNDPTKMIPQTLGSLLGNIGRAKASEQQEWLADPTLKPLVDNLENLLPLLRQAEQHGLEGFTAGGKYHLGDNVLGEAKGLTQILNEFSENPSDANVIEKLATIAKSGLNTQELQKEIKLKEFKDKNETTKNGLIASFDFFKPGGDAAHFGVDIGEFKKAVEEYTDEENLMINPNNNQIEYRVGPEKIFNKVLDGISKKIQETDNVAELSKIAQSINSGGLALIPGSESRNALLLQETTRKIEAQLANTSASERAVLFQEMKDTEADAIINLIKKNTEYNKQSVQNYLEGLPALTVNELPGRQSEIGRRDEGFMFFETFHDEEEFESLTNLWDQLQMLAHNKATGYGEGITVEVPVIRAGEAEIAQEGNNMFEMETVSLKSLLQGYANQGLGATFLFEDNINQSSFFPLTGQNAEAMQMKHKIVTDAIKKQIGSRNFNLIGRAIAKQKEDNKTATRKAIYSAYQQESETGQLDSRIEQLNTERTQRLNAGMDTSLVDSQIKQYTTMRQLREANPTGIVHDSMRMAITHTIKSLGQDDWTTMDTESKIELFRAGIAEAFGTADDGVTPLALKKLNTIFDSDLPMHHQLIRAMEINQDVLLPAIRVPSKGEVDITGPLMFGASIDDLKAMTRLANQIAADEDVDFQELLLGDEYIYMSTKDRQAMEEKLTNQDFKTAQTFLGVLSLINEEAELRSFE
tara:strand:- start:5082 stop:7751 length:2670 start_codon:yes stop_codon:yes gene_type:complete